MTNEYTQPHVHTALAGILSGLSVEKGGTLPSNMGGKSYVTASDLASEVKRKFVENNLIFLPEETIHLHKEVVHKDRINILISITGKYTIISTKDGSSVTVSGTGDGMAGGTAVASNIASTNAMKNALLRTFLITEQSVEDAAKNGDTSGESATAKKIEKARTPTAKPVAKAANNGGTAQEAIRIWIGTDEARKEQANTVVQGIKADKKLTGNALYEAAATELGV